MTQERFYAAFCAYTRRKRGISPASAATYYQTYLKAVGAQCPRDYLRWIATCADSRLQQTYVDQLDGANRAAAQAGVFPTKRRDNHRSALNRLEEFLHRGQGYTRWSHYGADATAPTRLIRYEDDVAAPEQVPQLCGTLEQEFDRIRQFAKGVFGTMLAPEDWEGVSIRLKKGIPDPIFFDAEQTYLEELRRRQEEERELTEEEKETLRTGKIPFVPLAFFRALPQPHIEIFYQSVVWEDSWAGYLARLVNCIAHEYMHYLHYTYAAAHGNPRPFRNKNLNEGVADFFGAMYSLHRGGDHDRDVAVMRYVGWTRMFGSGLPYANALFFYRSGGRETLYTEDVARLTAPMKKLVDVLAATGNGKLAALRLVL